MLKREGKYMTPFIRSLSLPAMQVQAAGKESVLAPIEDRDHISRLAGKKYNYMKRYN
jgi:hypothetical protein